MDITYKNVNLIVQIEEDVDDPLDPAGLYFVAFRFNGSDNLRGQIYVNQTKIFDSYTTGTGTNRVTTGYGIVASIEGGRFSYLNLTGAGDARIRGIMDIYYIKVG